LPNKITGKSSGTITVGIKNSLKDYFDEFNDFSAIIEPLEAPRWLEIISITQ